MASGTQIRKEWPKLSRLSCWETIEVGAMSRVCPVACLPFQGFMHSEAAPSASTGYIAQAETPGVMWSAQTPFQQRVTPPPPPYVERDPQPNLRILARPLDQDSYPSLNLK